MSATPTIVAGTLGALLVAEHLAPAFAEQRRDLRRLAEHDLRNLLLGLVNALLNGFAFGGLLIAVDDAAATRGLGLTRWLGLYGWSAWVVVLLAFDCWMYWWHRLNHVVPFLWRFHQAHHSDQAMDASSGLRFHPGEIALSGIARLAVVPLLGMTAEQLTVYGAVALPIVLMHHANIRLPHWLDFGLFQSGLLVTPAMHRVHHSQERRETNSNYSSVLSVWDRLFGSLIVRRDIERIAFGLDNFADKKHADTKRADERAETLVGLLKTPLAPTATGPTSNGGDEPPSTQR